MSDQQNDIYDEQMLELFQEQYDDLIVQAMLFDMDIDIETLTLVAKDDYQEPIWLTKWKDKEHGSDQDNRFDYDQT